MTEILTIIRTETREWHSRIEGLIPVLSEGFTLSDYRELLELMYGFYTKFEPAVGSVSGVEQILPDWLERRKVQWLEEDLLWLGYAKADLPRLPACTLLPPLDSLATVFGALYVTEGSTLGGQMIGQHLARSLRVLPGKGATFFAGHGIDTAKRWKIFTEALSGIATSRNESVIARSAKDTFMALWLWLSQHHEVERLTLHDNTAACRR